MKIKSIKNIVLLFSAIMLFYSCGDIYPPIYDFNEKEYLELKKQKEREKAEKEFFEIQKKIDKEKPIPKRFKLPKKGYFSGIAQNVDTLEQAKIIAMGEVIRKIAKELGVWATYEGELRLRGGKSKKSSSITINEALWLNSKFYLADLNSFVVDEFVRSYDNPIKKRRVYDYAVLLKIPGEKIAQWRRTLTSAEKDLKEKVADTLIKCDKLYRRGEFQTLIETLFKLKDDLKKLEEYDVDVQAYRDDVIYNINRIVDRLYLNVKDKMRKNLFLIASIKVRGKLNVGKVILIEKNRKIIKEFFNPTSMEVQYSLIKSYLKDGYGVFYFIPEFLIKLYTLYDTNIPSSVYEKFSYELSVKEYMGTLNIVKFIWNYDYGFLFIKGISMYIKIVNPTSTPVYLNGIEVRVYDAYFRRPYVKSSWYYTGKINPHSFVEFTPYSNREHPIFQGVMSVRKHGGGSLEVVVYGKDIFGNNISVKSTVSIK